VLSNQLRYRENSRHEIIVSCDLGKAQDFSTLVACEAKPVRIERLDGGERIAKQLEVLNIRRLPLGTPYTSVAAAIYNLYHDKRLWLQETCNHAEVRPELVVDAGGVGDPVCDELERHMGMKLIRYKLVRGTTATTAQYKGRHWTVPRSRMFSMLDGAFSSHRIIIDPRLALAKELTEELKNLKIEQDEETGYVRVTHREGAHDDLSIALAAANWWVNEPRPQRALRIVA